MAAAPHTRGDTAQVARHMQEDTAQVARHKQEDTVQVARHKQEDTVQVPAQLQTRKTQLALHYLVEHMTLQQAAALHTPEALRTPAAVAAALRTPAVAVHRIPVAVAAVHRIPAAAARLRIPVVVAAHKPAARAAPYLPSALRTKYRTSRLDQVLLRNSNNTYNSLRS